ncbi:AMP-binding protein [Amycolatopsis sp. OK19-0408]|uniref:AMP-binding protein n=1 Tax=Amycolatopsis iheyensis TaxID=2945988 RepID=A0A9X2SN75_9PSEU|nr:AMP-binding protein [Amycolatopsis iheyensis]MCR6488454.1 AMP-binding protein [Amycolatopsis iheyensis]
MMFVDYLDRGSGIDPQAPCMIAPDGTVLMTHEEFTSVSHRVAVALLADGLQPGDRVSVLSPNDAHAFACIVGVIRAGGIWTAAHATHAVDALVDFLGAAGCTRMIYHGSLAEHAGTIVDRLATLRTTVSIGPGRPGDPELTAWMAPEGARAPMRPVDSSENMLFAGTGGTTGKPKILPINNRQAHLMYVALTAHAPEPEPPRYLIATPMAHAGGSFAFPVLGQGGSVILHREVVPEDILTSIERNRATRLFLPAADLYDLLDHPSVRDHDYSSLRHFLLSASPVAPERLAEAVAVFGPVMAQFYSQSEAPLTCTVLTPRDIAEAVAPGGDRGRLASCGRPTIVARVEIIDDDGNVLPPGQPGEIAVRSDLVFSGYWENPEATAETRRPHGWHGTGDIGVRDEAGFFYVVDRKRDMIIVGGHNVFSSEVEAFLHTFPDVKDCAVIGLPDEKQGEAVTAVVEPKAGKTLDVEAILRACEERLGPVKAPKSILVRELPRSTVGKVLKRELRDEYWAAGARKV